MTESAVVHLIAGARPNFMKIAPAYHELKKQDWCQPVIVHTGQHYDVEMSDNFFRDLELPRPDVNLDVGSGSHAEQTAGVMVAYERLCRHQRPDWTVVVGDVNSTIACALAATKLGIPVAHLEAGLRSRDRTMPEEINRILTDAIADLLWTPSPDADENLRGEGVPPERIERVGNIMIDSYELLRERIEQERMREKFGLQAQEYGVVTLHRPSNVDRRETLAPIIEALAEISKRLPLVFPLHPRTRARLEALGLAETISSLARIHLIRPISYVPFMSLVREARLVITDSGGVQEETTYLGIPCLTLRENTERPITIEQGTNRLTRADTLVDAVNSILENGWAAGVRPALWDGHTAERVAESLRRRLRRGG